MPRFGVSIPSMAWNKRTIQREPEAVTKKWIDFHSHTLPGIDDGSYSAAESLRMLRQEAEQNVGIVIATPHFYATKDQPEAFLRRRDEAEEKLRRAWEFGLPRVAMGAEVAYFTGMRTCEELNSLCIRGTRLLLVEMPFCTWSESMVEEIICLQEQLGFQVLLAHVERYLNFRNTKAMKELYEVGVRFQVNAGSFLNRKTRSKVMKLLDQGKLHVLGSDCHNLTTRPPNLALAIQCIEKEYGADTTEWLRRNAECLLGGATVKRGRSE